MPKIHIFFFKNKVQVSLFLCFLLIMALFSQSTKVHAAILEVTINGGPRISRHVVSLKEARFKNVVSQSFDFSCGAASLATLLKYQFGKEITERDVMKGMLTQGDQILIKRRGFSFLDMKAYAQSLGYQANGYKLKIEQLGQVKIPTIVLINVRGYSHFVVLKGVIGEKVYTADPAWGNRVMDLEEFLGTWNNVIFVAVGPKEGIPVGLAAAESRAIMPKGQILRIKDKVLDSFVMDSSTLMFSGSYPWW
ncbi:MAG: C39 family peptidase [Deltaproteobacteria bacterium]|nr:C39 family peptidase [Deltaproteobacteria bacterium]MBW2661605.1 C39 family peptidase [Deltaproteobacteria bacterium]